MEYLNDNSLNNDLKNKNIYNQTKEQTNINKTIFNDVIDDLIRKKTTKENEIKNQIEKNKKILLEKFYSMANVDEINNTNINLNIPQTNKNIDKNQILNNTNTKILIPNNKIIAEEGQKEYDDIKEKYKNERTKQKSSIFKSEDLCISNTNSVHLSKGDFSPINPSIVNIENKNNVLIIQKKLFAENEESETSKIENIDEINDFNFDIKDVKIENSPSTIKNNMNNFLDSKIINFDLSSNLNEINHFQNETLFKERAIEFFYLSNKNADIRQNKKNRLKNFSVQIASQLGYYTENKTFNFNKKKKLTNKEINEMKYFIQNLIPQTNKNTTINSNGGINNNININNINNNIHIINTKDSYTERNSYIKLKNGSNKINVIKNKLLLNDENYRRLNISKNNHIDKKSSSYNNTNKIKKLIRKSIYNTNNNSIKSKNNILRIKINNSSKIKRENKSASITDKLHYFYPKLENYQKENNTNNVKKIINNIPSISNPSSTKYKKVKQKKIININKIGNKSAIINTLTKNNIIKFSKSIYKFEAINKIKQHSYSDLYFIYVEKINEGFLFKGLYKRGVSEINNICNKIYGVPNTPFLLFYAKFIILIENNKKEFTLAKLSNIYNNYGKSILLIKND